MKAILKNSKNSNIKELYYYKGDEKIIINKNNIPDFIELWNDIGNIRGDASNIGGDVRNIGGDVSNIIGDVSNIYGDIDLCKITKKDLKD